MHPSTQSCHIVDGNSRTFLVFQSCFSLLCSSKHPKVALDLLHAILSLRNNSYWLVKVWILFVIIGFLFYELLIICQYFICAYISLYHALVNRRLSVRQSLAGNNSCFIAGHRGPHEVFPWTGHIAKLIVGVQKLTEFLCETSC